MEPSKFLRGATRTPISDLCSLQNGRAFKPSEWSDSGTPIIRIQNLNDPTRRYNYYSGDLPERFRVRHGDVLLSWSGTPGTSFGCFRWTGIDGWLNQHIFNVRLDQQRVLPDYFVLHVNAILDELIGKAHGGVGLRHITKGRLDQIELSIPSIDRQHHVIDLLSRAENIVRMRREAVEKAKEIIPALFLDMFGDPATNPKGWPVRNLPDVLSEPFKNGLYLSKEHYADEGSPDGVEMIHMSDAFYGEVRRGKLRRVTAAREMLKPYLLSDRDLLVARRSLNWEGAAKLCRLPPSTEPIVFESSFIRLRPDPDRLATDYLYYYMNSPRTRAAFVEGRISGITISGINQAALSTVPVMVPNLASQKRFCEFVTASRSISASQNCAVEMAGLAFQSLLAGIFEKSRQT